MKMLSFLLTQPLHMHKLSKLLFPFLPVSPYFQLTLFDKSPLFKSAHTSFLSHYLTINATKYEICIFSLTIFLTLLSL